jgi:hypothetical protein
MAGTALKEYVFGNISAELFGPVRFAIYQTYRCIFLHMSVVKNFYSYVHKGDALFLNENGCKKFILQSGKYTVFFAACEVQTVRVLCVK